MLRQVVTRWILYCTGTDYSVSSNLHQNTILVAAVGFVRHPNEHEMPDATLTVKEIRGDQRGNYTCIITSSNAKYNPATYVRVKSVYAALWPFIGIVVEMLLL